MLADANCWLTGAEAVAAACTGLLVLGLFGTPQVKRAGCGTEAVWDDGGAKELAGKKALLKPQLWMALVGSKVNREGCVVGLE